MNEFLEHLQHEFELPLGNPVQVFFLILFIILVAPILLRRINVPGIIGLIIAGVLIGPHGFHLLEQNSAVDLFSTIGLLYIMFIAGLELDMNEFVANRNKSFLFGFFTFILPLAVGFPACYYILGYDFSASFLTASMFATHTLVAYTIVSKLGVSKNQAVAITVGGTILTDTAVLIILAIIMGSSQGSLNSAFWIRLVISLSVFAVIMFWVIPRIAKWFFRNMENENYALYIFVLFVVFLAAFLAEIAGVEPIIGAFVAGLALNRLIPHSSALMNRIEFIGNALFIPFFLISVGMLVDVSVILSGPMALLVAATLTIASLFGKWLAAFLTQLIFRYTPAQRQLIFGLSSAHAAATLAVILVGYKAGIIDENILNGTIVLILVTCLISSFVTEKASKKVLLTEDKQAIIPESSRIMAEHILIPVVNEAHMEKLLKFGLLVKNKKSPHPITLLSVVSDDEEAELNILKAQKKLDEFVNQGAANETEVNPVVTIDHTPAKGIARMSRELMANIIIIGWSKSSGFQDKMKGERVASIIHDVDKNLMICHFEKPFVEHRRIVVVSLPLAEKEKGFETWLLKTIRIAQELAIPLTHYGDEKTQKVIRSEISRRKLNTPVTYQAFPDWDNSLLLAEEIRSNDFIILISARKGSISYRSKTENVLIKLEKLFEQNNKIIIYPQQYQHDYLTDKYEDFSEDPLTKGLEKMEQIRRNIGRMFKKN